MDTRATPPPLHRAQVVREGTDFTLLAYGPMVKQCLEVAAASEQEGRSLEVMDLRYRLSPLDIDTVQKSVEKTGRLVVAQRRPSSWVLPRRFRLASASAATSSSKRRSCASVGTTSTITAVPAQGGCLPGLDRIIHAVDRSLAF